MQWMNFLPCDRTGTTPIQVIDLPPGSLSGHPLIEAIKAVHDIVSNYPPPHTLMLSGGVDSQAMLWAWYQSGLPFEAVTFKYDGFNSHDIEMIKHFIEVNHIPVNLQYKNIDVIDFLENDLSDYSNKYDCSSPQICTHMRLCEEVEMGTVIFSGNFVLGPSRNGPMLSYAILGIQRFAEITKRPIIPFFFLHSKELAYSFLKYDDPQRLDAYETKVWLYQTAGFPVIKQETKYTGFERLKDLYDEENNRVTQITRLRYAGKPSTRNFDLLFRYPYEQKINDPRIDYIYSFLKGTTNELHY